MVAIPAAANVSYDAGLLRNLTRHDPGFNHGANRRWSFTTAGTPLYAGTATPPPWEGTGVAGETGHFGWATVTTVLTGRIITNDSPSNNFVSVSGGDTYILRYRVASTSGDLWPRTDFQILWFNATGVNFETTTSVIYAPIAAANVWYTVESAVVRAPAGARNAIIRLRAVSEVGGTTARTVRFDGVEFHSTGPTANVYWPIAPSWNAVGDTSIFTTSRMPANFARKTRTGYTPGREFKLATGGWAAEWAGGFWITGYDTFWAIPSEGANAQLHGGITAESFVTVVSRVPPDGAFGFLSTSRYPIHITAVEDAATKYNTIFPDSPIPIEITLNVQKSPEEEAFLRFSTDNFATSSFVRATGVSDTLFIATLPGFSVGTTVHYYALTTPADTPNALIHARADQVTLSMLNNAGANFTFTTRAPNTGYDPGLMRNLTRHDPGFNQGANRRWTFTATDAGYDTLAGPPSWEGMTMAGATRDVGHFRWSSVGAALTDRILTNDSPSNNFISVSGGETFAVRYRVASTDADFRPTTDFQVLWFNDVGSNFATTTGAAFAPTAANTWFTVESAAVVAPAGARNAVLRLRAATTGNTARNIHFDGVEFHETGPTSNVHWPIFPSWNAVGDTSVFTTSRMPLNFARKTRTGHTPGQEFKIATSGWASEWSGGFWITGYDTFWAIPSAGANAQLHGGIAAESFVTVVSRVPPDGTFGFLSTSRYPIHITAVEDAATKYGSIFMDSPIPINITLNVEKSQEEEVFLRFSTDSFTTSSFVRATGTGTAFTATLPGFPAATTVTYYALTTPADTPNALIHARADYVTLSMRNNAGANFTFTTQASFNAWHIPQNDEPWGAIHMRRATRSDTMNTMWPRRRTTDNPVVLRLGRHPSGSDTPTTTLFFRTKAGGAWSELAAAETTVASGNTYFRFDLNQPDAVNWDFRDTISYYFRLARPGWATTFVHGSGAIDDVTTSNQTTTEAAAQSAPFIYRIISTAPDASGVVAINPPNSQTNVAARRPTITWSNATDVDLPAGDSLDDYFFEISRNPDMSAPIANNSGWINDLGVRGETRVTVPNTLDPVTHYWRVRTVDNAGLMSGWSNIFSFTITGGARLIDGVITDWATGNLPATADTSLIRDSEYVWRAATADERVDFASPDRDVDIRSFRVTGDANNLYWMTEMVDITSNAIPMTALAIDVDRTAGSGQNVIGGLSRTTIANEARWEIGALANLTRTGYWTPTFSEFRIRGDGWIESADTSNVMEQSLPWSEIGVSPPATLRFTLITGRADGVDFLQHAAWHATDTSRVLDGITTGPRKASQSGNWWGEVSDANAGYFFDVDFDTAGHVVMNNLTVAGAPASHPTFETFAVTVTAQDFNRNPVGYVPPEPIVTHTGVGNLVTVSSGAWAAGARTYVFRHERQETITVTIRDPWTGRSDTFRTGFVARPVVRITEVAMAFNNNLTDSDFVEFFTVDDRNSGHGVNLAGWVLRINGTLRKTFGPLTLRTGSFGVVSFGYGTDETTDAGDSLAIIYAASGADGIGGIAATDRVVDLRDASGTRSDVVIFDDNNAFAAGTSTEATNAVAAGHWDVNTPAGAVSIASLITNDARGISRETPTVDNNTMADWRIDTLTQGSFPLNRFRVTAATANPTAGVAFNLTIQALDWRGALCSYYVGTIPLTVSAGTISPTSVTFIRGLGEMTVAVTLNHHFEDVTITAAVPTGFGTARGETTLSVRPDLAGPNAWFVNDGATGGGDVWTTAVGDDANSGFSPGRPRLTISSVIPLLTAGDSVFIDAGTFLTTATLRVETPSVTFLGVDSTLTIIDFADSSVGADRAFLFTGTHSPTIQNLEIQNARHGLILRNVDSGVIRNVRSRRSGEHGFLIEISADSNHLINCHAIQNTVFGFYFGDANRSLLSGNRAEASGSHGFMLAAGSETKTLTGNRSSGNGGDGFHLTGGSDSNLLTGNVASGNATAHFTTTGSARNTFIGNTASGGAAQGFFIASNSHLLRNNLVTSVGGDGIALVFAGSATIDSNTITSPGGRGIFFEGASGNTVRNNLVVSPVGNGVAVERNSDDNSFTSDTIRLAGGVGFFIGSAGGGASDRNTVTNARVDTSGSDGFRVDGGESNTLIGAFASGGGAAGFALIGASDSTSILSCTAIGMSGFGFFIASHRNSIRNSRAFNVGSAGFSFVGADLNFVVANTAESSVLDGFRFETGANSNIVSGNRAFANLGAGLLVSGPSSWNIIEENQAAGNAGNGFFLQEVGMRPVENVLRFNLARNNAGSGFRLFATNGTLMAMNRSDSNAGWAFYIDPWSNDPRVIKNNIIPPTGDNKGLFSEDPHTGQNLVATRNWWGTRDTAVIFGMIGGTGRNTVSFTPFRLGMVDTAAGADTVAPRAPDTVAAHVTGATTATVTWSAVTANEEAHGGATGLTGYRVYRATDSMTSLWPLLATVAAPGATLADSNLTPGIVYFYRVTAFDAATPHLNEAFYSDSIARIAPAWPTILIGEVGVGYTNLDTNDSDFIELFVVSDGMSGAGPANLSGWKIHTLAASGTRRLVKNFGSIEARAGSFVNLWFASAVADETNDLGDSRVTTCTAADNNWMPTTQLLIELEAPDGSIRDVVVYSDQVSLNSAIATRLSTLVGLGQWGPDATAANTVSSASLATRGRSIRRPDAMTDLNIRDDWTSDFQTPGNMSLGRFVVVSDSANPIVSESFTLRVHALDTRNDTIVGARFNPTLTVSSGSITPTSIRFVPDHSDWNSGDTAASVAIHGTSGPVTCTVTFVAADGARTGTTTVNVNAPLESFVVSFADPNLLVASPTVRRGSAFNLRIVARDIQNNVKTDFAGTVTLSVESGTITPSTIAFHSAWLGDTTCSVTISGGAAVGRMRITASAGGKSGRSDWVIPLSDNRIVINEVLPVDTGGVDRDDWVELYNRSREAVSINGWVVTDYDAGGQVTLPAVTVPSGKYVVIHCRQTGTNETDFNDTDGAAHLFPFGTTANRLAGGGDDVGLYTSTTHDSSTIIDYTAWTSGVSLADTDAAGAGIWTRGDFISFTIVSSSYERCGRTIFRAVDGRDTNRAVNDWSLMPASTQWLFTEGFPNVNTQPDEAGATLALATTSSPAGDTFAAGDTIHITLNTTAGAGANPAAVDVTTVWVYSDTDPEGIVVWLRETGNNTLIFRGEAYVAWQAPLASHDGMRVVVAQPGDSLTVSWIKSPLVRRTLASVGGLDRFVVTSSSAEINAGAEVDLTIRAVDRGGFTKTDWTGTVSLTTSVGTVNPATAQILAGGNGETTITVTFTAGPGVIVCTATAADKSGTTVITILPDTDYVINEVMVKHDAIDWDNSSGATVADEWVEIYNKGSVALPLTNYVITHAANGATVITLQGEIPARGWVTAYRRSAGAAMTHHYDSMGVLVDTRINLGGFTNELPDAGGVVQLRNPDGTVIAMLTYSSMAAHADRTFGRIPDGASNAMILATPSPGTHRTPAPHNVSSPNAVFAVNAPDVVNLNAGFPLAVAMVTRAGETVATFHGPATLVVSAGATISPASPATLNFASGVSTTTCTFTSGTNNESYSLTVFIHGAIRGVDTMTLLSVSTETSRVATTQAIADGIDTARVQVVVLTAVGTPLAGLTVNFSSSKGGADVLSAASAVTNAHGVAEITVRSTDTTPSRITVVVAGVALRDSPFIHWLDPAESGVRTSFGLKTTLLTVTGESRFIQFPQWRANGSALAYLAKTAAHDTWNVYVAYDDGTSGDAAANDGNFAFVRVTGVQHQVNPASKIAFQGANVIFSSFDGANVTNLYAVAANGADVGTAKAGLTRITTGSGLWAMPVALADTTAMYGIYQGSIYRFYTDHPPFDPAGGGAKILEAGTVNDFMIDGVPHAVADIVPFNRDIMAVTMINNQSGNPHRNRRSVILILTGVDTAQYRQWTSINGTTCRRVARPDNMIAWNLAWAANGRALTWARDLTGNFNWIMVRTRHSSPKDPYVNTNFDVEAIHVAADLSTPNRPVSLINNAAGFNDLSNSFAPAGVARTAYVSHHPTTGEVKLNVLSIDGEAAINEQGGLLFHNGKLTAVVDSGAILSGSVRIQVGAPVGAPANPTPDSIALTGRAREFFPHGQRFADSISVIIHYDDADLAAAGIVNGTADEFRLKVYWWNGSAWIDYNAVVDPTDLPYARGKLTFQTNHFSTYGLGFEPTHPNRPTLLAPGQGEPVFSPRPSFSWIHNDPQSRPQSRYRIQVSLDAGHGQTILDETVESSETTVTLAGDLPRGESTLHWRVRTGATKEGFGAWSNVDSVFVTRLRAPLAPMHLQPADGAETRSLRPIFSWMHNDPDGASQARFRLQLARDSGFATIGAGYDLAGATGSFEVDPLSEGVHFWRVATADQAGWGPWSPARRLTINRAPLAPTIVVAPETLTHPSPAFAWIHRHPENEPQTAARLELALTSDFAAPFRVVTVAGADSRLTLGGDDKIERRGELTVHYRLRTTVDGVNWGKPAIGVFAATLNPPLAPLPLEPADGLETAVASFRFRWTHRDSEADPQIRHQLRVARDHAFGQVVWSSEAAASADSLLVDLPGAGGRYWWQVATWDQVGPGPWSAARSFILDSRAMTPLPASPAAGALLRTPHVRLAWTHRDQFNAPQSAARIEIATEPTFATPLRTIDVIGAASERTLTGGDSLNLAPGDHPLFWRARTASFGVDHGAWSEPVSFTLRLALPAAPTLLTPADGRQTREREFSLNWRHEHAELEQTAALLQLARDSAFTAPREYPANTDDGLTGFFAGGTTWWRVRTAALTGWGPWSAARAVEIDTSNFAPALLAPIGGEPLSTPTPVFRWRHVDPAGNPQSAARIEIAVEPGFAVPLRTLTRLGPAESTTLAPGESIPLVGVHTLYWRARTASYGLDYGPVSGESGFVAHLNPPLAPLAVAPNDTTRNRHPEFTWTHRDAEDDPQVAARIQIARHSDFAAPIIEVSAPTSATAWIAGDSLVAGTWFWRAATRDAVGWGAWSAPLAFAVDTFPLWRRMSVTTSRAIPAGETRTLRIELFDEFAAPTPWSPEATVRIGDLRISAATFTPDSRGASRPLALAVAGIHPLRLHEDVIEDSVPLTILAVAAEAAGGRETYLVVAGAAGDAQFLAPTDTSITVASRVAPADSALRLRIVAGEMVIVADLPPTRLEEGMAFWEAVPAGFTPASRVITAILRNSETLTQRNAYVLSDPAVAATFSEPDTTSPIRVVVPANASDSPIWIHIRRNVPETSVADANLDLRRGGRKFVEGSAVEITARAQGGAKVDSFQHPLTFRLPAAAANGLKIAWLRNGRWVELATTYDTSLGLAVTEADHLSVWGLVAGLALGNSVNEVIVYPNPWRSDGPTAHLGPSNTAYGVKFDRMPAGSVRIRIFTLAGELVLDGTLDPSSLGAVAAGGNLQVVNVGLGINQVTCWNLRNQSGREVASGVYLIILEGPGGRATRKVAIIR